MNVSPATWDVLSKLLDEALDLDAAARAAWLEQLTVEQPELAPSLRKLLAAHATSETVDVLARLPHVAPGTARASPLAIGDRVGPYRLKREIGAGGMADVWLAERADGAFAREVALKLPLINRLRRDLAQRFARERDILARLEHPHIARLYDAGVATDGLPYLAMEYVDGQPIVEYCDQRKLTVDARLQLFLQVLEAVQYAHANLIIHRDLKPSNILVTDAGQVRLLDFGIAKLLAEDDTARETQLTQLSGRALTPDYASPEQIMGEPLTTATDIYSLGVVLYELLVGSRPYRLKLQSVAQLEQAIVSADPPRPSTEVTDASAVARSNNARRLKRSLSGDLDTIVLKALGKTPTERYQTANAFAEDLARWLDGRPVRAQAASWTYRARKYITRNKLAFSAIAITTVSLVVGAGVAVWQAQQARTEQHRAQQVKAFLASIFLDIDPNYGRGGRVPASAILMNASHRIEDELGADPRLALEVATLVASGLMATSEHKAGGEIVKVALQRHATELAATDPLVLRARATLIRAHANSGTLNQVAAELAQLVEHLRKSNPPLTEDLVFALVYQASLDATGDRNRALALMAEASRVAHDGLGDRHKASIEVLSHWSNLLVAAGKAAEAETVAQRGVTAARAVYKRPHPMISGLERRLADAMLRTGRPADAASLLKQVLEDEKTVQGEGTLPVALAESYLGLALAASGEISAGLQHLQRSHDELLRLTPDDHQNMWIMRQNLAGIYLAARMPTEALRALDLALSSARAAGVREFEKSPASRRLRCTALVQLGRLAEAKDEFLALEATVGQVPPTERSRGARCAAMIARLENRAAEAIAAAESALAALDRVPVSVSERAGARAELGFAHLEAGDIDRAHAELTRALDEFKKGQVGLSPLVADVELALGRVALARNDQITAQHSSGRVLEYWRATNPSGLDAIAAEYWYLNARGDSVPGPTLIALRESPYPLHRKWAANRPGSRALRQADRRGAGSSIRQLSAPVSAQRPLARR